MVTHTQPDINFMLDLSDVNFHFSHHKFRQSHSRNRTPCVIRVLVVCHNGIMIPLNVLKQKYGDEEKVSLTKLHSNVCYVM